MQIFTRHHVKKSDFVSASWWFICLEQPNSTSKRNQKMNFATRHAPHQSPTTDTHSCLLGFQPGPASRFQYNGMGLGVCPTSIFIEVPGIAFSHVFKSWTRKLIKPILTTTLPTQWVQISRTQLPGLVVLACRHVWPASSASFWPWPTTTSRRFVPRSKGNQFCTFPIKTSVEMHHDNWQCTVMRATARALMLKRC